MDDLIYNQKNIPKNKWRYGFRSSAATGCGWIATYNALRLMGYHVDVKKLIRYFTWQVPLINGNMGTFLLGPAIFFRQKGFTVKIFVRRRKFDAVAKESDVCVMFYYWRSKLKVGAHFVTIKYQDGKFIGYNTYSNSIGTDIYGDSLEAFLKKNKKYFPVLMGIRDKR